MPFVHTLHRSVRAALALATACLAVTAVHAGPPETPYVRISAEQYAKDPQKVAALRKAVAAMRAADSAPNTTADYRGSWQYWAATHGYFGQGPNSSGTAADFIAQAPQMCQGLPKAQYAICLTYYPHVKDLPLPNDGFTSDVWGTCQHSDPSGGPSKANLQFLTWHRMYLIFFERVMRKHSGDPNFTLPYWDYYAEKGPNGKGIALPTLVRGTSTGPMYDAFRTPGLNDNKSAISNASGSAAQAFKFTDFQNFSFQLEMQPHGAMHCATGFGCQAPDMGIVPVAGLDPVFYMHHANIDRLWQCWLVRKSGGQPITLEWAKANLGMDDAWFEQTFTFADENGNKATMAVKDLFMPGVVDYQYAQQTDCVAGSTVMLAANQKLQAVAPMSNAAPVPLKGKAVSVPLRPAANLAAAAPEGVRIEAGRVLLRIEDVTIQGSPGVTYDIYLHAKNQPSKAVYVATFNYFGLLGPQHGAHAGHGAQAAKTIKSLFYDVTAELAQLGVPVEKAGDVSVRFVPSSGLTGPASTSANAGTVTVGSIKLHVAR